MATKQERKREEEIKEAFEHILIARHIHEYCKIREAQSGDAYKREQSALKILIENYSIEFLAIERKDF